MSLSVTSKQSVSEREVLQSISGSACRGDAGTHFEFNGRDVEFVLD